MGSYKEPVRLRQRVMASGMTSLYLDIYERGKRKYEYLKLYLVPETTKTDRDKNRETLRLAETIRAKRVVEIRNGLYGFDDVERGKTLFYPYYERVMNEQFDPGSATNGGWRSALNYLRTYDGNERLTFADVTAEWVGGFKTFLEKRATTEKAGRYKAIVHKRLSPNTQWNYFAKLKACIHMAVRDGIMSKDVTAGVGSPKRADTHREFLTLEELRRLTALPHERPTWKRAFLFSCMTGLRYSDIKALTWGEVTTMDGFTRITFKQKKTGGLEYLDVTPQAVELMGERGRAGDVVFQSMPLANSVNIGLARWMRLAGIDKHITFHSGRHTFAVMMLDLGVDIYTVSKLLGHREITTTQIYAKVLDKNKRRAVEMIPKIL